MKKVTVAKLKNNLSRYLEHVRRGGRVLVFNRQTPVAELVPVAGGRSSEISEQARLQALERQGIVRLGSGRVPDALLEPLEGQPVGVLDALLEERAGGR